MLNKELVNILLILESFSNLDISTCNILIIFRSI